MNNIKQRQDEIANAVYNAMNEALPETAMFANLTMVIENGGVLLVASGRGIGGTAEELLQNVAACLSAGAASEEAFNIVKDAAERATKVAQDHIENLKLEQEGTVLDA